MTNRYLGFVPYLFYDDLAVALEWYTRVFGFEEINRWTNEAGKIHNAEMRVGDCELWLDGSGRRKDSDPRPHWIGITVDDVDAIYSRVRAAGVQCDAPVDREFGVRMLNVPDPMGYLWGFIKRR
ncbi:MAG: VOC family protein [Pseudomonadota bacterium]